MSLYTVNRVLTKNECASMSCGSNSNTAVLQMSIEVRCGQFGTFYESVVVTSCSFYRTAMHRYPTVLMRTQKFVSSCGIFVHFNGIPVQNINKRSIRCFRLAVLHDEISIHPNVMKKNM